MRCSRSRSRDDHRTLRQGRGILRGLPDRQRSRRQDAMTLGIVPGADAGELQRHHFPVEQRDQPAHWPHETLG